MANNEKEITKALDNKINIINTTIDDIIEEVYNIQLYNNMLNNFVLNNPNELNEDFKSIVDKINDSIEKINIKYYLLEINKLTKIVKTNSGNFIEISTPICSPKNDNYKNTKINNNEYSEYVLDKEVLKAIKIDINKIGFNVNNYENKKILSLVVYEIFLINVDFKKIDINCKSMKKFIFQVSLHYYNNPYHNFKHAVSVLQFIHLLINKIEIGKYFSDFEVFGLLMAALVHDIGHPGNTNLFEINNKSHLALKYNDNSVLENHHCSLTFYIIHSKGINLFENLNQQNFSIVRNMIIECVLATDMKHHMELVKNLEDKFFSGYACETQHDRLLLGKILLHIADLSNQIRPFDISYQGSIALRNEFTNQIKKEERLNLPIQDYMKFTSNKSFYSTEYYFSSNVVKPMWNLLVEIFPELNEYYNNLNSNINKWKELLDGA